MHCLVFLYYHYAYTCKWTLYFAKQRVLLHKLWKLTIAVYNGDYLPNLTSIEEYKILAKNENLNIIGPTKLNNTILKISQQQRGILFSASIKNNRVTWNLSVKAYRDFFLQRYPPWTNISVLKIWILRNRYIGQSPTISFKNCPVKIQNRPTPLTEKLPHPSTTEKSIGSWNRIFSRNCVSKFP